MGNAHRDRRLIVHNQFGYTQTVKSTAREKCG